MPSKKFLELQEFSDADLKNELTETESQFRKMRFDHEVRGLDNPLTLREVKRDIARLKTEVRRREIASLDDKAQLKRSKKRARR